MLEKRLMTEKKVSLGDFVMKVLMQYRKKRLDMPTKEYQSSKYSFFLRSWDHNSTQG